MKTVLYKDSTSNELKTFEELKEEYAERNNSDLPIDNDTMLLIVMQSLVQNGGNLILLKDDILAWCNDYSEYNEADRCLSQVERDESVKNIYHCIMVNDEYLEEVRKPLMNSEEGAELLKRLDSLLQITAMETMKKKVVLAFQDNHKEMIESKKNDDFENYHECKGFETAMRFVLGLYGISYDDALKAYKSNDVD